MTVQLKIRDIRSGESKVAEFESVDDAEAWLRERPPFTEVLGPARQGALPPEEDERLRLAVRPLDDEEKAAQVAQDERDREAMQRLMDKERARAQQELEARREANRNADPDRPMNVVWERGKGSRNADPVDERPVTPAIDTALAAWVAERDTWVHSRGQYVSDALVVAWPGPIPSGSEDDRIQPGGQFNTLAGTPPELN